MADLMTPDEDWLTRAQRWNRAAAHGVDQALFGVPSAAVHGARALMSGDWSGEAQRRLDAKERGLSDLKSVSPWAHKGLMELTSMPVPSNPHSAVNAIAAGAGKMIPAIFAGIGAKTAPLAGLERAKAAEAAGAPRENVWKDHGWFKGRDGHWRWEIDDSNAKFLGPQHTDATLGDALHHPELYRAYPQLSNVRFTSHSGSGGAYTSANRFDDLPPQISVGMWQNQKGATPRNVALHESDHAVKDIEGMQSGGNLQSYRSTANGMDDLAYEAEQIASRLKAHPHIKQADPDVVAQMILDQAQKNVGRDIYHRTSGEVEARAVQSREYLTPEQRRARPPWLDYDVPESQQIVHGMPARKGLLWQ